MRKYIYTRGTKLWSRLRNPDGKWINKSTGYAVGDETKARRYAMAAQAKLARKTPPPPDVLHWVPQRDLFGDRRLPKRFWNKVHRCPMSGCWLWTGYLNSAGYGHFSTLVNGKKRNKLPHRLVVALREPLQEGLHVDHLCKVRHCCNPTHLEQVTPGVNARRGRNLNREKTHCPRGHEYDLVRPNNRRGCSICKKVRNQKYRRNRRL